MLNRAKVEHNLPMPNCKVVSYWLEWQTEKLKNTNRDVSKPNKLCLGSMMGLGGLRVHGGAPILHGTWVLNEMVIVESDVDSNGLESSRMWS